MLASQGGHEDVLKLLLGAGARRDMTLSSTRLFYSYYCSISISPSQVNNTDMDGVTALMLAANGGHENAVRVLLEAGAFVKVNSHPLRE
eukprot:1180887-Prorocentrum_minimum.AAC.2